MTQVHDPRAAAPSAYGPPAPHPSGPYAPPPFGPPNGFGGGGYGQPPAPRRRTGVVVGSVVSAVVVLAGLVVGALLLFATPTFDSEEIEGEIVALTEEQIGVAVTDVTCPEDAEATGVGATITCTAQLEGQETTFTVEQTDDEGNAEVRSDDVYLEVATVEETLTQEFTAETGLDVVSSCDAEGRTVLVAADGLQVTCTVSAADDPSDSVQVVATVDARGEFEFEVL